jgi:hypothetical protein
MKESHAHIRQIQRQGWSKTTTGFELPTFPILRQEKVGLLTCSLDRAIETEVNVAAQYASVPGSIQLARTLEPAMSINVVTRGSSPAILIKGHINASIMFLRQGLPITAIDNDQTRFGGLNANRQKLHELMKQLDLLLDSIVLQHLMFSASSRHLQKMLRGRIGDAGYGFNKSVSAINKIDEYLVY